MKKKRLDQGESFPGSLPWPSWLYVMSLGGLGSEKVFGASQGCLIRGLGSGGVRWRTRSICSELVTSSSSGSSPSSGVHRASHEIVKWQRPKWNRSQEGFDQLHVWLMLLSVLWPLSTKAITGSLGRIRTSDSIWWIQIHLVVRTVHLQFFYAAKIKDVHVF